VDAPDASTKLRLVLDYLPCEACLAQPVRDQDLLCSVCRRLHRQVAVRVATRSTVILERPDLPPPAEPVVIPPAPEPQPEPAPPPPEPIPLVEALPEPVPEPAPAPPPLPELEVVTEPLEPEPLPAPEPVPMIAQLQEEPPEEPEPARKRGLFRRREPEPPPPEPVFDDVAGFEPAEDSFGVARGEAAIEPDDVAEVAREEFVPPPPPPPEPVVLPEAEPEMESDFVFRPTEETPAPPPEELVEDEIPVEEIPVVPESEEPSPWAPQEEIFPEEAPEPTPEPEPEPVVATPLEEEVVEMEVLPDEPPQEEILEAQLVEEDEPIAAEIVEEETIPAPPPPAPAEAPASDLHRLRGFSHAHEDALHAVGIDTLASLAGHDAHEIAARAGLAPDVVAPWVQVADLVHELGVPIDSASALVAAGVAGPRGLREMTEEDILDRVEAFGGVRLSGRDVKRWKRRA
jgi:predicted flap endonuclease-1-like 5' DNA nuclease